MQYDSIEELMLELSLYPNKKLDILEDCAKECEYGWFTVAKDGNCALFDENGDLDDINKVKTIKEDMIPKGIEKINIPDSVTDIMDYAFHTCSKLLNIIISNSVTNIGNYAFYGCERLTSATIGNGVTNIGNQAFECCRGLTSVAIGTGVKSIGKYAFAWCSRLMSVTIPDSVTSIGNEAFFGCSNRKKMIFKGKTIEEVQSMENYPFGIKNESIIRCEG